ncbi:lipopolysaccharide biosynthesis protein [Rufibacter immobilis]|uniref:Lipopolysaccharide biosynthesis protein n=1 Tax=Rufibacter immobilis TaxID=1348778 RepID=A0A3M9N0E0_9BACT|nr:lipopolysaccharide biosynthesis protein [Rufibacter immobilis]RNI30857.1 lipopolysaccharide biosynthesis protein [Rufibacter immobilis]
MSKNLKEKAYKGFVWSSIERFGTLISDFVISIFIARILSPKEFGLIAMVAVFTAFLSPFVDAGLGKALIRKKEPSDEDYSTVFWWNLGLSIIVYLLIYLCAPVVANFYDQPLLVDIMRVMGLLLIIQSLSIIQTNRLLKRLDFKPLAIRTITSSVISGVIGLYLAYVGWSYWALVVRSLIGALISSILLWSLSRWKPSLIFSLQVFKELFGFGSKLLIANLLDVAFKNIYPLIIGKYFSAASLGLYSRAVAFKDIPQNLIIYVTSKVTYPIFAELQDENSDLRAGYSRMVKLVSFIYFPLLMGIMGLSKNIVLVLLTEKWLEVVPMLKLLVFVGLLHPIHSINLNLLTVKGKSNLFLYLEVVKKILIVIVLVISYRWGILGLIYGQIVQSCLFLFINTYFTDKLIDYGILKQFKDILISLIISVAMGLALMWGSEVLSVFTWWSLIVWIMVGSGIYVGLSFLFNDTEFKYLRSFLHGRIKLSAFKFKERV